eukprot:PITA_02615
MEHIEEFQKLHIRVKDIPEEHRIDVFIGYLKDNIQHDVRLWEPDSLEKGFRLVRKMESKIMATKKHTTHNYKDGSIIPSLPQPIRLTRQQLEEKRAKGICYSCDSKYIKGHKCAEKKLFYIDCEEEEENEQERSKEEDILQEKSLYEEEINPTISCNALAGITTPQTIKIEGQIKKRKVIVLIDSGRTHNFIHCHKCAEKKLFYIACEEEDEKEQERSKEEDILWEQSLDKEEMNLIISCNALARITTPQTIKIEGQIKKKKVIVLIDSESTHNFIHCKVAKELNCFLYPAPECQVMIANGGTINCSGKCHNIKLSMG